MDDLYTKRNEAAKIVSELFHTVYIGGSTALCESIPSFSDKLVPGDIDLFILGPKSMCTWAVLHLLRSLFDNVTEQNNPEYYKIPGQYKRITASHKGLNIDLIFANCSLDMLIHEGTASDLSRIYYLVKFKRWTICAESIKIREKLLGQYIGQYTITIDLALCNESHMHKMIDRAKLLGFESNVINTNQNPF